MIKKILSTLLVSSALFVFAATGSMAERPTFAIGYTAAYGGYEATGAPCQEAGVAVCRGAGDQENADRDTGTDQPASAGTWLACFESTVIYDSVTGSSRANRLPQGRDLGRARRFWAFTLVRVLVAPCERGNSANQRVVDVFRTLFYSARHPAGSHGWGNSLIWEMPDSK